MITHLLSIQFSDTSAPSGCYIIFSVYPTATALEDTGYSVPSITIALLSSGCYSSKEGMNSGGGYTLRAARINRSGTRTNYCSINGQNLRQQGNNHHEKGSFSFKKYDSRVWLWGGGYSKHFYCEKAIITL